MFPFHVLKMIIKITVILSKTPSTSSAEPGRCLLLSISSMCRSTLEGGKLAPVRLPWWSFKPHNSRNKWREWRGSPFKATQGAVIGLKAAQKTRVQAQRGEPTGPNRDISHLLHSLKNGGQRQKRADDDWRGECALRRSGASHSRLTPRDEVKGPHLKMNAVACWTEVMVDHLKQNSFMLSDSSARVC